MLPKEPWDGLPAEKALEKWLSSLPRHIRVATVTAVADTVGVEPAQVHAWLVSRGCKPVLGRFLISPPEDAVE